MSDNEYVVIEYYNLPITVSKKVGDAVLYPIDDAHPADYDDFDEILDYYEYKVTKWDLATCVAEYLDEINWYSDEEFEKVRKDIIDNPNTYLEKYLEYIEDYFRDDAIKEAESKYVEEDY